MVVAYLAWGELGALIGGDEMKPAPVAPGTPPLQNPAFRRRAFGFLALTGASGFILTALLTGDVNSEDIRHDVEKLGAWGPILLIAILALAMIIAPIPNPPFMIAAGIIWGTLLGVVYSVLGQLLGSAIIFIISRKAGRRFIPKLVGQDAANKIDKLAKEMGPQLVFWWRMMPVSFDFAAYAAGLTTMRFPTFITLVFFGSLIPTTVVVSFGDSFDSSWAARGISVGLILVAMAVPATIFYLRYRATLPPPKDWLRQLAGDA
jgi:uncharacterized membrane protein YdjX (TVP38/TMEM64 family)